MKFCPLLIAIFFTSNVFCQKTDQYSAYLPIKAYIAKLGLDSISKEDLFKEKMIQLENSQFKILKAVAYFSGGESFKNVLMQEMGTNNLGWITRLNFVIGAKTPFKLTIDDIWYLDSNGKKQLAKGFTLVVY
jgi:hypothetical protein